MPIEVAASRGWSVWVDIVLLVTNPLEKFPNLSIKCLNKKHTFLLSNVYLILLLDIIIEMVGRPSRAERSSTIDTCYACWL